VNDLDELVEVGAGHSIGGRGVISCQDILYG
jgi:hypothetical protein